MKFGTYRVHAVRITGSAAQPARKRQRRRGAVAASAAMLVGCFAATPSAFAAGSGSSSSSSGSATFSLSVVPQIYSVTVSQSVTAFSHCANGNSTATALGFPNGTCLAGSGQVLSGYVPAVTITNTGLAGNIDVSGQNAVPSDGGTSWSLCTANVTGPTLCGTNGSAPGANQYSLFTQAYNEQTGLPNVLNTPACDIMFDVTANGANTGCTAAANQVGKEGAQLTGPSSSGDSSSAFSFPVTWTAVPSS